MLSKFRFLVLALALPVALHAAGDDDPQAAINAKLREGLRNMTLQLRDAQGQLATLTATHAQDEVTIKDLTAKLEKLTKASAADKAAADKTIADYEAKFAAQDARNAQQVVALSKWKKGYEELLAKAKEIDAKRAELATQKIELDRKVADLQRRNIALYDLGKEILHRYERYGLGDAILAREPFVGVSKVKFENYIQDNADKLADQKAKP
jgi:chromosome segregation ATPase